MMRGKLIVIEGIDGSGKRTQSELLYKNFKKHKIKAELLSIPIYDSFTGEMVARYLRNDFGRINPYLAATLYAVNRFEAKEKIVQWLKDGKVVVLDRYVTANQIHQAANLPQKDREKFKQWVAKLEYEIFGMPKADLILFMNVPVEIALKRVQKKNAAERTYAFGAKRDILESDMTHQKEALKEVIRMAKKTKIAQVINIAIKGQLSTKEEIANQIWQITKSKLKV